MRLVADLSLPRFDHETTTMRHPTPSLTHACVCARCPTVARHYGSECVRLRWLIRQFDDPHRLQGTEFGRHVLVRTSHRTSRSCSRHGFKCRALHIIRCHSPRPSAAHPPPHPPLAANEDVLFLASLAMGGGSSGTGRPV